MNTFTRSVLFTAMAAVGLTQGCSCSDDDDPVVVNPPAGETITISGMAAKGLVLGGVVNVHPIVNGVLQTPVTSSATTTDSVDGSYAVTIQNYDGNPFVVRVTTDENTQMRCDLPNGCGGNSTFGGTVPLNDASFTLDAVVPPIPSSQNSTNVNLSVLTDTAAEVVFSALNASPPDTTLESISNLVRESNSRVANRFRVTGDLTSLPVVDLTNPAALVNVAQEVIEYNLLSVGVVESLLSNNVTTSIADAVNRFSTQYAGVGLADTEETAEDSLTLSEILSSASNVINAIRNSDTDNVLSTALNELQEQVDVKQGLAEVGSTEPDQGTPSETTGATALEKAQALVAVISDLGANIDLAAVGDTTVGVKATELKNQLDMAEEAVGNGVEQVLEATAMTVNALSAAAGAYEDGTWMADGQGMWAPYTSEDGIEVSIMLNMSTPAEGEDAVLESVSYMVGTAEQAATVPVVVDDVSTPVMVYMTANDNLDTTEAVADANDPSIETSTAAGDISIMGTAEVTDVVKLTVKDGSVVSITDGMAVDTMLENGSTTEIAVSDIDLSLMAMLEQTDPNNDNPISFDGSITADLSSLSLGEEITWTDLGESGTATVKMVVLELSLEGTVMNAADPADSAAISILVKGNSNGIEFAESWLGDETISQTDTEAADVYAKASINASMTASLAGISDAVVLSYRMARTSETTGVVGLDLSYPGVMLTLTTTDEEGATSQTMRLVNQDGVVMTIVDDEAADNVTGTIFVGTEKLADIDGPIVRYTVADTANGFLDLFDDSEETTGVTEAAPLQ